ncbi:SDR family oxidoreductase [Pedobacter deserti]|uniref:SDR family oxidoreductase n=1 Tax=Pedobacter deserti TaxID=2817382 RepID=UPI00210C07F9|nr:SDR family oxidoreductase [Pedobacter sp. SYSU D00382]
MSKTIVITGASSGVGKAIALAFAERQDRLFLASRNERELEELVAECRSFGAIATVVKTDVTESADMVNLAAIADEQGAGIDVWVNNAGVLAVGPFDETPMVVQEQVIKTNLLGYMHGAHAALPYFKKQQYGILINNISIGGFLPVPFGVAYSASKFGLRGFSAALKTELAEFENIHVCDIFPAFLDTPGIQHAANYTGKQVRPAPPIYDPRRIASTVTALADNPTNETMIGSASRLLRLSYALMPGLTKGIAGAVIKYYLNRAEKIEKSDGNLFNPVRYGNAVYGGWGLPGKPKAHRKYIGGGIILGLAAALLLLKKHS